MSSGESEGIRYEGAFQRLTAKLDFFTSISAWLVKQYPLNVVSAMGINFVYFSGTGQKKNDFLTPIFISFWSSAFWARSTHFCYLIPAATYPLACQLLC